MSTKLITIRVSNLMIDTVKKDIRNMHLGVYPPTGRIRVAAPLETTDESIRLFVMSKMHWIKRQQGKFNDQERQTRREYVSGESHYFFGKRYRLNVVQTKGRPRVEISHGNWITLFSRPNAGVFDREAIFEKFYRSELRKIVPNLLEKWQSKLGVQPREVRIKKMKTKWGTCNPIEGRIWLNLELVKKASSCIDYVFVHELVHLEEKKHSERFFSLLESAMPYWKQYKGELNNSTLSFWKWDC